jgi:hypothetical protein
MHFPASPEFQVAKQLRTDFNCAVLRFLPPTPLTEGTIKSVHNGNSRRETEAEAKVGASVSELQRATAAR